MILPKAPSLGAGVVCALFLAGCAPAPSSAQIQAPNIAFPADAGYVNVRDRYGAKGDGKTDDTAALNRALNAGRNVRIYLPNGTYLVSDSVLNTKRNVSIVVQGQSRDGVVIKLRDFARGFEDPKKRKLVLSNYSGGDTNDQFANYFYNFTVDVGQGNPGAVALQHTSNNTGGVYDVTLRSSDPQGRGAVGLDLTQGWPGPSIYKNLRVEGFDLGVDTFHSTYSLVFEHLRLQNQRVAGIRNRQNILTIRDLQSEQAREGVPALVNQSADAMVSLLDSRLSGKSGAAIEDGASKLFLRDVTQNGYAVFVENSEPGFADVTGATITEYVSHGARRLFAPTQVGAYQTLRLPVEEVPEPAWDAPENWVEVEATPDTEDDETARVQAAFDRAAAEGKTTVYFPGTLREGAIRIGDTIRVHGSVRRVFGSNAILRFTDKMVNSGRPVFRVEEVDGPVVFERMTPIHWGEGVFHYFEQNTTQPLVLKNITFFGGSAWRQGPNASGGKLFIEDVAGGTLPESVPKEIRPRKIGALLDWHYHFKNMKVWARQWNPEGFYTLSTNDGSDVWALGLKTESEPVNIWTKNGGRTEVLGGLIYPLGKFQSDHPGMFVVENADASLIYGEVAWGEDKNYDVHVRETQEGQTRLLTREIASAGGRGPGSTMPLFVARRNPDLNAVAVSSVVKTENSAESAAPRPVEAVEAPAAPNTTLSIRAVTPRLQEGGQAGAFELTRTGAVNSSLDVRLVVRGKALEARDYGMPPLEVRFAPSQKTLAVPIAPLGDDEKEGNESVEFSILPSPAFALESARAEITLADDDVPATAGIGTGLRADFYEWNKDNRWGALRHTRIDEAIDFAWNERAPAPGVPGGGSYAVVWHGFVEPFESGDTTFTLDTDYSKGARLWVDGKLLLDHPMWKQEPLTGKIALTAFQRTPIRVEYFTERGWSGMKLRWEGPNFSRRLVPQSQLYPVSAPLPVVEISTSAQEVKESAKTPVALTLERAGELKTPLEVPLRVGGDATAGEDFAALPPVLKLGANEKRATAPLALRDNARAQPDREFVVRPALSPLYLVSGQPVQIVIIDDDLPPPGLGTGLKAEYFTDKEMTVPKLVRTDARLDLREGRGWEKRRPDEKLREGTFYARWSGQIQPLFGEEYTFTTDAGSGRASLWVNGQKLIADKSGKAIGKIALEAGQKYDLKMEYATERDGWNARLKLEWQSASQFRQTVPPSQLYPAP